MVQNVLTQGFRTVKEPAQSDHALGSNSKKVGENKYSETWVLRKNDHFLTWKKKSGPRPLDFFGSTG